VECDRHASSEPAIEQPAVQPRIYVASLSDYNNGVLHGDWIDATLGTDDIHARIKRILATSPTTPEAEEFAVHDYEEFGEYRVGEYEPIERIHRIAAGINTHGPAYAAWAARCDNESLDHFLDAYLGEYESGTAYAEQLLDDLGLQRIIDEHIPEYFQPYVTIDADAFARDLQQCGDIDIVEHERGVWIFDPNG